MLTLLTAIEFLIAFTVPEAYSGIKVAMYILLTIAKAFYIVAYFMHLKFERINFAYSVVVPAILLLYLIALLIIEGGDYFTG
jgi:cytochrome c oxidase subunit IV